MNNILAFSNILDLAKIRKIDLVYASSSSIYGNAKKGNDLPFISDHQVTIGTDIIKGPYSLGVLGNWKSSQWSSGENISAKADDTRIGKIPARWVWDVKGNIKITNTVNYNFGVHNVFTVSYTHLTLPTKA